MSKAESPVRYRVIGMDCANDAAEIEAAVRAVGGVEAAKVSTASHILTLHVDDDDKRLHEVKDVVARLGYGLDPLVEGANAPEVAAAHTTPEYRRALWLVVLLNAGYGVVEMVGGFLSGSQALKADALDFLGDGLITFLGLLGALGLGVLTNTAYRFVEQQQPEAELMGILAVVALVVNVAAAAVLIPHRTGDSHVRAVWLFSRNDAIGNAAVVVAAALVAWSGTSWPDLVVAAVIAGLFLHSSWLIVRDARADLREARA